jgi:hypothetical protein
LYACLVELHDILDVGPADQGREVIDAWTAKAYGRATTVLNRLERMTPPSREWNELLDAYSALTRKTVAAIPSGVTPDQRRRLLDEGGELSRRYEDLRAVLRKRGHR